MSEKNIINVWPQLGDYPKRMFVEAIHDDWEGFRIILADVEFKTRIRIAFINKLSYRNTDEGFLLQLWETAEEKKLGNTFYLISNSTYIDFFNEMSYGIHKDKDIKHYAIYSDADCIDVLSIAEPVINLLD